jgi:hypothetical protein
MYNYILAYWQAANITQLIFVGKNAVNKHLPQGEGCPANKGNFKIWQSPTIFASSFTIFSAKKTIVIHSCE